MAGDSPPPQRLLRKHSVETPINVRRLAGLLNRHSDHSFSHFVLHGLCHGFTIGHSAAISGVHSSPNHLSAIRNMQYVSSYLTECCEAGQTAGPFPEPPFLCMQTSGLGVVPKSNGKLRVIHDLSSPDGSSVNDAIPRGQFSLHYDSVDTAIAAIMRLGKGSLLTKVDIRNAFRLCPVAPSDWHLLGIRWNGMYYYEKVLPFGLRSSPFIFNQLATAINWVLVHVGSLPDVMHYLDDFLDICPPSSSVAAKHKAIILDLFQFLNIPVATEKVEGPSTVLTFLGLELDTDRLEVRLPQSKLLALRRLVSTTLDQGCVLKRELASLLGHLSFASRAIPAGRTFLRRLYDLDKATSEMSSHRMLHLSASAKGDLSWWHQTLSTWNGKSFFLLEKWMPSADLQLQTDASGTIGFGAFFNGRWFRGDWSPQQLELSITYKELFAIVAACATWGIEWLRLRVEFQCDNQAVVECLKTGTSRSPAVMALIRTLYSICVKHNFLIRASHLPGISNTIADALSRNKMDAFRTFAPTAAERPDTMVQPITE